MTMDFSAERLSYEKGALHENLIPEDARELFEQWVTEAIDADVIEPYAMSLATCGSNGLPSVRTLLMREVRRLDNGAFSIVFYSNYDSEKGQDIEQNPNAQALFFWHSLERQVRLSGKINKLSEEDSLTYFHKRPRDSQVAAWVSEPQSGVVESREAMEQKFEEIQKQYSTSQHTEPKAETESKKQRSVPKPPYWGGYELAISRVEFWQGRANRMHDRVVYQHIQNESDNLHSQKWQVERLLP